MAKKKILIYSHDSYGLGHLRRSQAIAHALVASDPDLSIIIISGSPVIGRFEYAQNVDFVRIPGVVKLHDGDYTGHQLSSSLDDLIHMRSALILQTYLSFKPDLILVDKEPLGLRGELTATLEQAFADKTDVVLGLRDIMDDQQALTQEWERKNIFPALEKYFAEIWVYGPEQMGNPIDKLPLSPLVTRKIHFTGYLHREVQSSSSPPFTAHKIKLDDPYMLVMAGGGGDGEELMRAMTQLYREHSDTLMPALFLLGPFMEQQVKDELQHAAEQIHNLELVHFSNQVERLISNAQAVVAMGGYNSFCEILSFNKPALIYPRTKPRMEQYIRVKKAEELGVVSMLTPHQLVDSEKLYAQLKQLQSQEKLTHNFSLQGLGWICDRVKTVLSEKSLTSHCR